jgi:hypothetical protein
MATTLVDATDSILSQFRTTWNGGAGALVGGPAPEIVYEALEPDLKVHPRESDNPWVRIVVRHSDGNKVSLAGDQGTGLYIRLGMVWVQVFCPAAGGTNWTLGQQLAMLARDAFEGKRAGAVVFTKVAILDRPRDGAWLTFDVKANFYWHEVR